jgi:hypothetical protein
MGKRTTLTIMIVGLVAIGMFVYASPGPPDTRTVDAALASAGSPAGGAAGDGGGDAASTTARHGSAADRSTAGRHAKAARAGKARAPKRPARAKDALDGPAPGRRGAVPASVTTKRPGTGVQSDHSGRPTTPATTPPPPAAPRDPQCSDFTWQQDAQAVYLANLSDPYGLDGPPGPFDDDGIACSLLPTDPSRPPSTPVGARPIPPKVVPPEGMPTTPSMEELLTPTQNYFGVSTPQTPYDWKEFNLFTSAAGKRPSTVEFFLGWDRELPAEQVTQIWRRGALPMLSWEPRPTVQAMGPDSDNTYEPGYKLSTIIDGSHDEYIDRFATAVRDLGLPVAIRFAHEMNGNWFPWSEERNGNSRGEYVQAWRHVHDRFTALGATNVIWVWSPNVITGRPSVRLAPLYPGDDYVDWTGMVGYYRRVYYETNGAEKPATFANTYQSTIDELRSVAAKPIFITEAGATEVGGNKAKWTTSLFAGMAANPDIIGFVWFDHSINGTDWRIESSRAATTAFATGVADDRWKAGKYYAPPTA